MCTENDEKMKALFDPETLKVVQKDYEYLQKMKEMDMEILSKGKRGEGEGEEGEERKGLEMTDVVPVGGLIMARYFSFFSFFFFSLNGGIYEVFLIHIKIHINIHCLYRFHMAEVEHSTAVDMWAPKENFQKSNFPPLFSKISHITTHKKKTSRFSSPSPFFQDPLLSSTIPSSIP